MSIYEGDYVRHKVDPELLLEVVRVEHWPLNDVYVVRDTTNMLPSDTFKVDDHQVYKVPGPGDIAA